MRFLLLSFLLISAAPAHAGTFTTREATLNVSTTSENWLVVRYCVEERCLILGREIGYSQQDWTQITKICEAKSYGEPNAEDVISTIGIISTYYAAGPVMAGVASVGMMGGNEPQASREEMAQTVKFAPFLRNSQISLQLDPDQVIAIRNGLISCMRKFDRSPELWIESCNSNFNCKQNYLAQGLKWGSAAEIQKADPWVLFNAQKEVRKARESAAAAKIQALD